MKAKLERRKYHDNEHVWVGRYRNLNNLQHWHIDHELVLCEKGTCTVQQYNQTFTMLEGDMAFFTSGDIHSLISDADSIVMVCIFDEHLDNGLFANEHLVTPVFHPSDLLRNEMLWIYDTYKKKQKNYQMITSSAATIICAEISAAYPTMRMNKSEHEEIERYRKLLTWIDSHYNDLSFEEAASFIGFTPTYFSRYFKTMAGTTFSQYVNSVRVENAIEMLKSGEHSISEIAVLTGFDSLRNFNRVFKNMTGHAPRDLPENYDLHFSQIVDSADDFDPTLNSSFLYQ